MFEYAPGTIVPSLRQSLTDPLAPDGGLAASTLTYNQSTILVTASLDELVFKILPLTNWWNDASSCFTGALAERPRTALMQDLQALNEERPLRHFTPTMLSIVQIVGLLAWANIASEADIDTLQGDYDNCPGHDFLSGNLDRLVSLIEQGWRSLLDEEWNESGSWAQILAKRWPQRQEPGTKQALIWSVNLNRTAFLAVQRSALAVKADAARLLFNIRCDGITWAIIDSGVDATHPAFIDWRRRAAAADGNSTKEQVLAFSRIKETYNFTKIRALLSSGHDLPEEYKRTLRRDKTSARELRDRLAQGRQVDWELLAPILRVEHDNAYTAPVSAHGTHVAGILAADWRRSAAGSGEDDVRGVCPDIRIYDLRVFDEAGNSDEFVILSALQFVRHLNANRDYLVVHGANLSLSLRHDVANYACGRTPVCEEVERLVNSGVVVVAAAGNQGYNRFVTERGQSYEGYASISITDPGNADGAITVGSTHRSEPHSYGVSYFSSRGPTGDGRIKPDLVAPGEKIYAPIPQERLQPMDGTSMAAPHVSGAAALLMARHGELMKQPRRIKEILCSTATDLGRERYFQGHGMVDVLRALQAV
jgi:serine protease AprX